MDITTLFQRKFSWYLWTLSFFLVWFLIIIAFYIATIKIDYVWRWYKIPYYFVYEETVQINSEIDGEVESVSIQGDKALVRVKGRDEAEEYEVPKEGLSAEKGDMVSPGDTLGSYQEWRSGNFLIGLWITFKVSILSTIFGILLGILSGLARVAKNPLFYWSSTIYVELIRGSPLLVQIFIWYFLLGTMFDQLLTKSGFSAIPSIWYGIAALSSFTGAYVAEIVRAGIESIHHGQVEAARSLGMTYAQSMQHIIMPQAIRRILPPLAGQFINLVKDSSLLGIMAITELTKATREIITTSLQTFEGWMTCALLYLIITFTLSMFVQYLERRMAIK